MNASGTLAQGVTKTSQPSATLFGKTETMPFMSNVYRSTARKPIALAAPVTNAEKPVGYHWRRCEDDTGTTEMFDSAVWRYYFIESLLPSADLLF